MHQVATHSSHAAEGRPVFFDMVHSNNAARVRLWTQMKKPGGAMRDEIETRTIAYPDLQTQEFARANPLRKVPALIRPDGEAIFESHVILSYLEDKYKRAGPSFEPPTPEGRQAMQLLCRLHDLYVASPNCTAPGFSHSQGAMYLSTEWHGRARGMDSAARAAKLGELWRQLCWLEAEVGKTKEKKTGGTTCHLLGEQLTLADFTWFPTCVFMEYILPRVFGWPHLFDPDARHPAPTPFPNLAEWYNAMQRAYPEFGRVRDDIWGYWVKMDGAGQFQPIVTEISPPNVDPTLKFQYGVPSKVMLNYQEPPPAGKATGRYIDQPDRGDVVDEHVKRPVMMRDGRELSPPATLDTYGFALRHWPTEVCNFRDDDDVVNVYYEEMKRLVKDASGACSVHIFDHTVRESGRTNLNADAGAGSAAAPVPRVHCDYTHDGAPRRLLQLGKDGMYSKSKQRMLTEDEVAQLASNRFAFINVWRSIDDEAPCVLREPLAVCDERSVSTEDRFVYEG